MSFPTDVFAAPWELRRKTFLYNNVHTWTRIALPFVEFSHQDWLKFKFLVMIFQNGLSIRKINLYGPAVESDWVSVTKN